MGMLHDGSRAFSGSQLTKSTSSVLAARLHRFGEHQEPSLGSFQEDPLLNGCGTSMRALHVNPEVCGERGFSDVKRLTYITHRNSVSIRCHETQIGRHISPSKQAENINIVVSSESVGFFILAWRTIRTMSGSCLSTSGTPYS